MAQAFLVLLLFFSTMATALAAQEAVPEERAAWTLLAERCGEELRWAKDWDEAAERAQAERKPVLAIAWLYPGFDVVDGARTGFAMDEDVIELVEERCVPLRLTAETQAPFVAQERYGLSPTTFGTALLLVTSQGNVLADCPFLAPVAAYDFLCAALAAHPELPGAERPKDLAGEDRAAWHLARGELDLAAGFLAEPKTARSHWLAARLARRCQDREGARAALAAARTREPGELAAAIEREALTLALLDADLDAARAVCDGLVRAHGEREEALAARYVLGLLDLTAGDAAGAAGRWRALAAEHPASRWAVEAAAALLLPDEQLAEFTLVHSAPELIRSLREVATEPLPPAEAPAAAAGALRWLVAERRDDGTWLDPSELETGPDPANAISAAIDALGARALLAHGAEPADVAREAASVLGIGRASLAGRSDEPTYMTYEVWSDALVLELLADLLARGAEPAAELRALGAELVEELAERQRTNGGWSYFEAVSLAEDSALPEQSISFVTAAVVLALQRAVEAGIAIDADVLPQGLAALENMRDDAGVFGYMLWSFQEHAEAEEPAGAAGRGPLCELALLRAGRSDHARLAAALELFFTHSASLAKEVGKALMHCGPEGQGCHYVLYDYACAARAIAELPAAEQAPFRERLLALLLATRRADGAFLDTPVLGAASSTALALLAFDALDERE